MARMVKRSRAFHTGNPFQRAPAPQQLQPPNASKRCQRILEAALTNLSATERKHHLWKAVHLLEAISKVWSNGLDFWSWVPPKD